MQRLIKSIIALIGFGLYLTATLYLIQFYVLWMLVWFLTSMTGIGYSAMSTAQQNLRNGWAWWWHIPVQMYRWTLPNRKSFNDLLEKQKR